MVKVGDCILINGTILAEITALFLLADGHWYIGYMQSNGKMGFFLEETKNSKLLRKITAMVTNFLLSSVLGEVYYDAF